MTAGLILGIIVGTILGALVGVAAVRGGLRLRASRTVAAPAKTAQVVEKFGHPKAPVPVITRALPEVAYPLAWETWIDRSGPYAILVIRLTDLATEKTLETLRVSIEEYRGRYALNGTYPTWADYHRTYSSCGWDDFVKDVVAKTTDWARRAATSHGPARPDRTDYQLGIQP
ncbi:hypothetical protein ACT17_15195 [Mycolicibacterium conceptionense]|uniref:Uncharacterized protein n=1 Tax=Mycolicibacterium conceptionense TaxID=451644 RepID=A0A0J8UB74_9MYCO|nr:hypothetical protein [Mycolicibacterium conceptionense]KMV17625.1 hypothetical protein ACT17_15195 [Mycolicibacterium conceptionense]